MWYIVNCPWKYKYFCLIHVYWIKLFKFVHPYLRYWKIHTHYALCRIYLYLWIRLVPSVFIFPNYYIKLVHKVKYFFKDTFVKQKIYEVLPRRQILSQLQADICQEASLIHSVCIEPLNFFVGYDDKFNKVSASCNT